MKRLIAAIAIIIVCFTATAMGCRYVNNTFNKLEKTVEEDEKKAYDFWKEEKEKLAIILKHEDMDNLDEELENMKAYRAEGKNEEAEKSKTKAKSIIKGILQGERFSLGNIF